jgi:hypothetical protein
MNLSAMFLDSAHVHFILRVPLYFQKTSVHCVQLPGLVRAPEFNHCLVYLTM